MIGYEQKLARVLDRMGGVYNLGDIMERLDDGRMQAFAHRNSVLVTQVNCYPRAKALDFLVAVGDFEDAETLHDEALRFAAQHDISLIRAYGRRGWTPFIRDHGWRPVAKNFVYVKEL